MFGRMVNPKQNKKGIFNLSYLYIFKQILKNRNENYWKLTINLQELRLGVLGRFNNSSLIIFSLNRMEGAT